MKKTTQCYLEKDGCYLMLYRNKKPNDMNEGKWVAVGGKLEPSETPEEANTREVFEETGIKLQSAKYHGVAEFRNTEYEAEDMYLYSSSDFNLSDIESNENAITMYQEGKGLPVPDCDEGELAWVPKGDLMKLPMWEGDKAFLEPILNGEENIKITLFYEGDRLARVER